MKPSTGEQECRMGVSQLGFPWFIVLKSTETLKGVDSISMDKGQHNLGTWSSKNSGQDLDISQCYLIL